MYHSVHEGTQLVRNTMAYRQPMEFNQGFCDMVSCSETDRRLVESACTVFVNQLPTDFSLLTLEQNVFHLSYLLKAFIIDLRSIY